MEENCILGFDEVFEDGRICCGLPEDGSCTIEDVEKMMRTILKNG